MKKMFYAVMLMAMLFAFATNALAGDIVLRNNAILTSNNAEIILNCGAFYLDYDAQLNLTNTDVSMLNLTGYMMFSNNNIYTLSGSSYSIASCNNPITAGPMIDQFLLNQQ